MILNFLASLSLLSSPCSDAPSAAGQDPAQHRADIELILRRFGVDDSAKTTELMRSFKTLVLGLKGTRTEAIIDSERPLEKIPRVTAEEVLMMIQYFSRTDASADILDESHVEAWDAVVSIVSWGTKSSHGMENKRLMSKGGRGTQFSFHHSIQGSGYNPSRKRLGGRDLAASESLLQESIASDLDAFSANPRIQEVVFAAMVKNPKEAIGVERELFIRLGFLEIFVRKIVDLAVLHPDRALRLFWQLLTPIAAEKFDREAVLQRLRTGKFKKSAGYWSSGGHATRYFFEALNTQFEKTSDAKNGSIFEILVSQIDKAPRQFSERLNDPEQVQAILQSIPDLATLAQALKDSADRVGPLSILIEKDAFKTRFGDTAIEDLCALVPGLKETLDSFK